MVLGCASRGHLAALCSPVATRAAGFSTQFTGSCPCKGLRRPGRPGGGERQQGGSEVATETPEDGSEKEQRTFAPCADRGTCEESILTPLAHWKMEILSCSPVFSVSETPEFGAEKVLGCLLQDTGWEHRALPVLVI